MNHREVSNARVSWSIFTRVCSVVSRSRTVTVPSSSVWKSTTTTRRGADFVLAAVALANVAVVVPHHGADFFAAADTPHVLWRPAPACS